MIYHGYQAVCKIQSDEGIVLTEEQERVVRVEGYSDSVYLDTKGIETNKVGQTGKWLNKTFVESFNYHVERVCNRIPEYHSFPSYLRAELIQAEYRGDLGLSPRAVRIFNDERYIAASEEFLNNAEYKNPRTPSGIKKRMEAVYLAMQLYSKQI